jgi:glucose-1-phosphate cytidylyltransferase
MKVVLFCGGLGTRLREHSDTIPKPLVNVGYRPIIWHLMRYYAWFGHKDFILALGYRGDMIREYFLNYREWMTNDFVMADGGRSIRCMSEDIADWTITFVDTGLHSNLGERLLRVRRYVEDQPMFLANYSDGLSDFDLAGYTAEFARRDAVASFVAVRPTQSFHAVRAEADGTVTGLAPLAASDNWINGGYFCLRREIFDYVNDGEELVEQPFARLIAARRLWSRRHEGFWAAMDTFKDKIGFDRMEARGECPWKVWEKRA